MKNKIEYRYDEKNKILYVGENVFKKGSLVRVYETIFSRKEPNDVNFKRLRDVLVTGLESPLTTHYYIVFRGKDINNPNPETNHGNYFNISKRCSEMRCIKILNPKNDK